ncbi:Uncharacterised protein [Mycobacterium tuberculosis]|nr:Uncharacterised protein [Mycobacterium tuberculosis]
MLKNRTTRQRPPHIGNIEAIIATHVRGQPSRLPPQRRSDFADTTHGTTGPAQPASRRGTTGTASIITCALVPLIPNDDTPARRVRAPAGHTRGAVNNSTAPADQSTCGLGTSTCNVAGNSSWRIANTILITPATPAAACV